MTKNLDQLREEMRTHAGLGWDHQPVAFEVLEALIDRVEAAEAVVQRVRDMHKPTRDPFGESCAVCVGDSRRNPYPCDTIRALDGGE